MSALENNSNDPYMFGTISQSMHNSQLHNNSINNQSLFNYPFTQIYQTRQPSVPPLFEYDNDVINNNVINNNNIHNDINNNIDDDDDYQGTNDDDDYSGEEYSDDEITSDPPFVQASSQINHANNELPLAGLINEYGSTGQTDQTGQQFQLNFIRVINCPYLMNENRTKCYLESIGVNVSELMTNIKKSSDVIRNRTQSLNNAVRSNMVINKPVRINATTNEPGNEIIYFNKNNVALGNDTTSLENIESDLWIKNCSDMILDILYGDYPPTVIPPKQIIGFNTGESEINYKNRFILIKVNENMHKVQLGKLNSLTNGLCITKYI